jgi:parallel beta-helix repeat protein
MPTLTELPQSLTSEDTDQVLIDRDGTTMVTTAAALREPMQKRLTLATGKLLGRVGVFPGGPEPVSLGEGLQLSEGVLSVVAPTLAAADASALAVRATGSTMSRSLAARAADRFNVMDFGAVGDGVANDRAAIQAAINAASARPTGGEVYLPPGTYRLRAHTGLLAPKSRVVMRGAGRGRSVLLCDDSLGNVGGDVIGNWIPPNTFAPLDDFHLRDLTLRGLSDTIHVHGAQMMRISGRNISIENCEFTYARQMGMVVTGSQDVTVRGCRVFRTNSDGIAVWDSSNVLIEGNEIIGANDDAISAHSNNTTGAPVRSGIVIANNTITESQGVAVLGAKSVVISNNVLRRIMGTGIRVIAPYAPDPQGNTAQFALRITGNIVADVFRRPEPNPRNQAQFYIMVTGGLRAPGAAAAAPGEPAPGTGVVTPLYGSGSGAFYANATNVAGNAGPAGYWNEISGNHLVRTLPAVDAVSDWGYGAEGLWVGDNGDGSGFYNGPVSESQMATLGIRLQPGLRNARIAGNTIQTSGPYGIWFSTFLPTAEMDYDGLTIEANRFVDFSVAAIFGPPNGTHRVLVRGNEFDGDPHFAAPTRGPGGTWTSADGVVGVSVAACSGFTVIGNAFRNLGSAVRQGAGTQHVLGPNTLHCDPVAVGFSAGNRGMGTVEPGGGGWLHVVETCDPADALYGRIRAATLGSAAAMPASGTYVAGHFVRASPPVVTSGQTLMGWLRLTTGSGHAAGTDWAAVHGGDGTPPAANVAKVTMFTASGTWTRDPAASQVEVEVWGGGGAGGNGGVVAAGTASSGGGGGGGGGKRRGRFRAVDLPATVTVTVGAAGARGPSAGSNGGGGGTSSFGTLLRAYGGGGGAGGGTGSKGGGGGAGDNNPGGNATGSSGGAAGGSFGAAGGSGTIGGSERVGGGGGAGAAAGAAGSLGGYAFDGGGGGASGGGVNAAGTSFAGGNTPPFNTAGVHAGGTSGGGTPAPVPAFAYGTPASVGGPGGGGGSATLPGGPGAAGQTPGGGGGGGGSTVTGQAHGLAGNGGGGLVLVYEW